ncbi:MAG TPA: RNA-binding protein [Firmicutes bacterium]|nr:RNA-binding protein [Bacillota bacterium]
MTGIVRMVQFDPTQNQYVAWTEVDSQKYLIPADELELYEIKGPINAYIGRTLNFLITHYDYEKKVYFASCKTLKEKEREHLIKRLKNGEQFDAEVTSLVYFGAYVSIKGVSAMLRNQDFAIDYTTVSDVLKVGDTIKVKLRRINENLKINVEAIEKYESESTISIQDFEPNIVVYGLIRNIKSWGCFVNIAPNLDAICPIPKYFEVKEGMKVAFKINQVRIDENRVRGRIIRVLNSTK